VPEQIETPVALDKATDYLLAVRPEPQAMFQRLLVSSGRLRALDVPGAAAMFKI
jgi:hypothetical protein